MNNESISVVIATFNSDKYLQLVLNSIKFQKNLLHEVEILIIDGGSNDLTLDIAKRNNCKILKNLNRDPVSAKFLGLISAQSRFIIFLDHDEVIESNLAFSNKLLPFKHNKEVVAALSTGYKNPFNNIVSDYINDFGDPFSFFMYRLSKANNNFIKFIEHKYNILFNDSNYIIPDFKMGNEVIVEIPALGSMIDKDFIKKNIPNLLTDKNLLPHAFYLIIKKNGMVGIMKNDFIYHYSSTTYSEYLNKISWRIKNNIIKSTISSSGFNGRENLNKNFSLKKYFFLVYALTLIFPFYDSLILSVKRKNIKYLIHSLITIYTAIEILRVYISFKLKLNITKKNYDGSE